MHIHELRLKTHDLVVAQSFYNGTLRLPVIEQTAAYLALQAGRSRLVFEEQPDFNGHYHFAFDIPENQIEAAHDWLTVRLNLMAIDQQTLFHSPGWNAHMIYFGDWLGNVVEFIARHNQPNACPQPFDETRILSLSEIGIVTDSVRDMVEQLALELEIAVYDGAGSDSFTALGDEEGLFVVVQRGRIWYPQSGIAAAPQPIGLTLQVNDQRIEMGF